MWKVMLLLVVLCTIRAAEAADATGKFTVLSMGTRSCGDVVEAYKRDGEEKFHNSIWVAGYLTAVNKYVSFRSDIATGTNPAAWNLWIFNYCSNNPLDLLHDAASALVMELSKRPK